MPRPRSVNNGVSLRYFRHRLDPRALFVPQRRTFDPLVGPTPQGGSPAILRYHVTGLSPRYPPPSPPARRSSWCASRRWAGTVLSRPRHRCPHRRALISDRRCPRLVRSPPPPSLHVSGSSLHACDNRFMPSGLTDPGGIRPLQAQECEVCGWIASIGSPGPLWNKRQPPGHGTGGGRVGRRSFAMRLARLVALRGTARHGTGLLPALRGGGTLLREALAPTAYPPCDEDHESTGNQRHPARGALPSLASLRARIGRLLRIARVSTSAVSVGVPRDGNFAEAPMPKTCAQGMSPNLRTLRRHRRVRAPGASNRNHPPLSRARHAASRVAARLRGGRSPRAWIRWEFDRQPNGQPPTTRSAAVEEGGGYVPPCVCERCLSPALRRPGGHKRPRERASGASPRMMAVTTFAWPLISSAGISPAPLPRSVFLPDTRAPTPS